MFTGIVEEIGIVESVKPGFLSISTKNLLKSSKPGDSIAVNGVCLTATRINNQSFSIDIMAETLRRTNLGKLQPGDSVNLEKALEVGGRLGGHFVQGHIDGTGMITGITPQNGATLFRITAPAEIMRYLVEKAYIGIEGISLTITALGADYFQVSVVEFTRTHTNLQHHKVGDSVNLEVDIMAKYAERFIQAQKPGISAEFLREQGF